MTRRSLLGSLSAAIVRGQQAAGTGKGQNYPPDAQRYADPATEFTVLRLTSPSYSSYLTAYHNRAMSGRNTLYFSSDRGGNLDIYRMDIRSGESRQLTSAERLDPATLTLVSGDRSMCYFDGPSLRQLTPSSLREREVYRLPDGWERGRGFSVSPDGTRGFVVERSDGRHRLRSVNLKTGQPATIIEADEPLSDPIPRPGHSALMYRRSAAIHLAGFDGPGDKRLALAPGEALSPCWSPDGSSVLYLNVAPERGQLNTIRELNLDTTTNKLIAKTTQYVGFGTNGDASVFTGASGSLASPHVLILIRSVRRELTLCEHRASDPRMVAPVFAPSSQRIVFSSDRHGKPAIYTMNVERFVEETES